MRFKEYMDMAYPNRMASSHATYGESDMKKCYEVGYKDGVTDTIGTAREAVIEVGSLVGVADELKQKSV